MKEFIDSIGGTTSELSEQCSVTTEEPAQYPWDSKDPVTVRDILQDIIFDPGSPEQDSFFSARWTEEPCFTGESNEEIIAALRTSNPRKPVFQNSTIKIFINSLRDDLTQEAEILFICIRIPV